MSLPEHIQKCANEAVANMLPTKSQDRYNEEYHKFIKWCELNSIAEHSETVLLAYFKIKSEVMKASTLWTIYSMLKSTLAIKHNINLAKFHRLLAFLKKQNEGYHPKKSEIFTNQQVETFLNNAPDEKFLLIKVKMSIALLACDNFILLNYFQSVLIIGIAGACRRIELTNISTNDVKFMDNEMIIIKLKETKNKLDRTFVINDRTWMDIIQKYYNLRPQNTQHQRFFIYYANNKCTRQPVGMNSIGNMPRKIAEYLQLPNVNSFTGHCFRRSSATILADKGVDFLNVKRHGGWKSSTVAEGYIVDSLKSKIDIANQFTSSTSTLLDRSRPSTSSLDLVGPCASTSSLVLAEPPTTTPVSIVVV